jgi:hypothetical protein
LNWETNDSLFFNRLHEEYEAAVQSHHATEITEEITHEERIQPCHLSLPPLVGQLSEKMRPRVVRFGLSRLLIRQQAERGSLNTTEHEAGFRRWLEERAALDKVLLTLAKMVSDPDDFLTKGEIR